MLLLATLIGCAPTLPMDVTTDDDTDLPSDDGGDDTGTDPGDDGGDDTGIEDIPTGDTVPEFDPPGGGFTLTTSVSVTSPISGAVILACTAAPQSTCTPEPIDGPVEITASTILHARVDVGDAVGKTIARSFFRVDSTATGFNSDLPIIVLWTPASGQSLETNTAVGMDVIDAEDGRVGLLATPDNSGRARIHIRGSSSSNLDKVGFDVEMWKANSQDDRTAALLGMPKDGDWVLYAPYYYDDALIRNALGYKLSNDIGRYASRTRFVEVFLATQGQDVSASSYIGVYMLTEEIEAGEDRVDVAKLKPDDIQEPEITGGYVFKRDRAGGSDEYIYPGEAGGTWYFGAPIVPVDPQTTDLETEQLGYLVDELDSFGWALAAADHIDPGTGRHYEDIIDVDSFIDHHILNVLFKNPDAFRLSGYFHKDREGQVMAGPLWDLDRTAGSIDSRAAYPTHWDASNQTDDTTKVFTYGWYGGLFADASFRDRYWSRWSELLEGELAIDRITGDIDEMETLLTESAARNQTRWGRPDFAGEVAHLREWMVTRHAWMSACIAAYADPRECPG
jgi:hypothetical protein